MRPIIFNLFLIAVVLFSIFNTPVIAKPKDTTRILITTSSPANFNSYWLELPPRLVIEFHSKNVTGRIDNEVIVNQGVIKGIQTEYFAEGQARFVKSLTFELTQEMPYKIWQELNTVILDIQTASGILRFPEQGKEVFAGEETKDALVKRLGIMDIALKKISTNAPLLEAPKVEIRQIPIKSFHNSPNIRRKSEMHITAWFIGIILIPGLMFLFWLFWLREVKKLKSQIEEKKDLLDQERVIRKTIESTSLAKEKEFEQVKLELEKQAKLLEEKERVYKTVEEELFHKEKECEQIKSSLESLNEAFVKNEPAIELSFPEEKMPVSIPEKNGEKRRFPRLDLSRDYNRTIILRIESHDRSKNIKSFADNISTGGLGFQTRKEFKDKEIINLRLFFFGDNLPIMKIKAEISWKKIVSPVNYCGVSFIAVEDNDKQKLKSYIESNLFNLRG